MKTELIVIEKLDLVPFFTKGDQLDDTLAKIKAEAMAHVPDVSTLKGRNAIKANVTIVTKSKTYLEGHGKDLAAEYKLIPKAIDANRKKSKDFLNALVEEIRKPLTDWETIEKAEKKQAIDTKAFLAEYELQHDDGLQENELRILRAKQAEADRLAEIKAAEDRATAKAEREAAERIAQAERNEAKAKQGIIDAKAKAEKSERERLAAEEVRTEEIRVDYHKRMVQHIVDCGNGFIGGSPQSFGILFYELENKIVIDEKFEEFQQEAEVARSESIKKLKDCQQKQVKDREDAEAKAIRDADAAAENARKCEIRKQEVEAHQAKVDKDAREANKRHVNGVKTKAMNDFIKCGLDQASARLAVKALAAGKIRSAGINY